MSDFKPYTFSEQCKQAGKHLQEEIIFTWTKADIMEEPNTPKNKFVKDLIRRNEDLERRLQAEQEEHQRVLSQIESMAAGRGKFG